MCPWIGTTSVARAASQQLAYITELIQRSLERLATGERIRYAADDPAGLRISERMRADIRSYRRASRNALDGTSLLQLAESAAGEIGSILVRLKEIALQAANGTLDDGDDGPRPNNLDEILIDGGDDPVGGDREVLQAEFDALIEEIARIVRTTEFNDIHLLDGSRDSVVIQIGIDAGETFEIDLKDLRLETLGLDQLDISTQDGAADALAALDRAIDGVSLARGELGASLNALETGHRGVLQRVEHLVHAESRIRDVDIARESAELAANQLLQQTAVFVLSQANLQYELVLELLWQGRRSSDGPPYGPGANFRG